jgi:pyruvate,orthophosphate dikinase
MTDSQFVFSFATGDSRNRMLLGGKGANLCEMTQMGLDVPPGFVITTAACLSYLERGELPAGLMDEIRGHVSELEQRTGKRFGSGDAPLLVSARSGSAMSMPGMMDTILNLGLNPESRDAMIRASENERFGRDIYRRFLQLFGRVALGVPETGFEEDLQVVLQQHGSLLDVELDAAALATLADRYESRIASVTGRPFPHDPYEQLEVAVAAVFRSWMGKRAVDYRRQFNITPAMANGTAVNICAMVYGNLGDDCATGVAFTRNPSTGENQLYGEYLTNAQGEDVVAGIRTPKPIADMATEMPVMHEQLTTLSERLEQHFKEVQDFEFTIERGKLYCLQTRNGKMNARATVVTSVAMELQGLIERQRALLRVNPLLLEQLMVPVLVQEHGNAAVARGLPASPGAASGQVVFDADTAELLGKSGKSVILVRDETRPEDIHGFFASRGILTSRGGKTSHAAVVARGMGKPCVSGCGEIDIDPRQKRAQVGDKTIQEGDVITVDGTTGEVFLGSIPTVEAGFFDELQQLLRWADEVAQLRVHANADTPAAAERARRYGAMGIGLCRTERMFNATDRLPIVQEMILAESSDERQRALDKLLPIQRQDFFEIFKAMRGLPVTVRLLDPPIHEFLPSAEQLEFEISHLRALRRAIRRMSDLPDSLRLLDPELHKQYVESLDNLHGSLARYERSHRIEQLLEQKEAVLRKVHTLHEVNPMLGHRGVRLGITHPEIYRMQLRAVLEAAAECRKQGIEVRPEIMVPQVCTAVELDRIREMADEVDEELASRHGQRVPFRFGTMIEVVRACMRASRLAQSAEFFSFGTNDLTQATFSFSREDAENKFLPLYKQSGILNDNPFEVLDIKGVGRLMHMAVEWGRATRPDLKVGICGEQGGHPDSIRFCHHIGLDYVSCSAPRVPIARLAAAQAKLREHDYGDGIFA